MVYVGRCIGTALSNTNHCADHVRLLCHIHVGLGAVMFLGTLGVVVK